MTTTTRGGLGTRLLVLLFLTILVVFPATAYADPLDPTWIGGFWDDDDFDYVILLVSDHFAPAPAVLQTLAPTINMVGVVSVVPGDAPFIECRLSFHRRGPPLA